MTGVDHETPRASPEAVQHALENACYGFEGQRVLAAEVIHLRAMFASVRAVLRDNRAPDGKWYVDAGTLVQRIDAALAEVAP